MKLKEEYQKHQEIWNKGYRFNPEEELFYTTDPIEKFKAPKGYEEWKVKHIDKYAYRDERLKELGINPKKELPKVSVKDENGNPFDSQIFNAEKDGSMSIIQYDLHRRSVMYERGTTSAGTRWEYCVQKRINPLYTDFTAGKYDFSEARNCPFWHPEMIRKFEEQEPTNTLVITEGQIKAFKAVKEGIPTVGLTSISHFKEKDTGELHTEILEFIHVCQVKKVVILWDGDCRNISSKDLEKERDITRRPNLFYSFARTIRDSLYKVNSQKKLSVYHATIKTEDTKENPKGIDDLLSVKGLPAKNVRKDFENLGEIPGYYIKWIDISSNSGVKDMREFYKLHSVFAFYGYHSERIKNNLFIFYGNTYKIEDGKPTLEVSADLKQYKIIGTEFYREMDVPMPSGREGREMLELRLEPWKREMITLQHGKDALHKLEVFDGFTNFPSHIDYQPVIKNMWNLYVNVKHDKIEGKWPTIEKSLKHVFGEQYDNEMILDYLTVLYRYPMQKLPIITLLSKEHGTGKSTFIYLLKLIFKQNMNIVSNNEITSDFNSNWISSLIVACEESIFDKTDAYEKLKALSTTKTVNRNEKNRPQKEIPCMLHFVFASNHEENFMKISKFDRRLWVRKVHPFKKKEENADVTFDKRMEEELPAFIYFLENREIKYKEKGALFFHEKDFQTDAFYNLVANSEPGLIKNLRITLQDYFMRYQVPTMECSTKDLYDYFGVSHRYDLYYLKQTLHNYFGANIDKQARYSFFINNYNNPDSPDTIRGRGRILQFKYEDFVDDPRNEDKKEQEQTDMPF